MNKTLEDIHFITSKNNDFFKKMKLSTLPKNRVREGIVLVEGDKSFREASLVLPLRHVLVDETFDLDSFMNTLPDIPSQTYTRFSNHLFNALVDTKNPQGIIGVFDLPDQQLDLTTLDTVVVLEGIQDPGNVGTIIRTAFCLGYQAVLLDDACATYFSPKVIRSSMGALFHIPCASASLEQHVGDLKDAGFSIVGADMDGDDVRERDTSATPEKIALLVGSEGQGLSETALSACDYRYRIPLAHEAAESLNVAVASGIMMYELQMQR